MPLLDYLLEFVSLGAVGNKQLSECLEKGLDCAKQGHITRALLHWNQARDLDPEQTKAFLIAQEDELSRLGKPEAVLSTGLILVKLDPANGELANRMGNLARRLGLSDLAKKLYKLANQEAAPNEYAFCNLVATLAKVELYDGEIKLLIKKYFQEQNYRFPPYQNDPNLVEKLTARLALDLTQEKEKQLVLVNEELKYAGELGDALKQFELQKKTAALEADPCIPSYESIKVVLKSAVVHDQMRLDKSKEAQDNLINLGLFALINEDSGLALACFEKLESIKSTYKYHNLLYGLAIFLSARSIEGLEQATKTITSNPFDRFGHANIGLMHLKAGHKLLGYQHLLIAADLLDKSEGLFDFDQFVRLAEESYEDNQFKDALRRYEVIAQEKPSIIAWSRIASLHMKKGDIMSAAEALHEILRIEPDFGYIHSKLELLHNKLIEQGDELAIKGQYRGALKIYRKALGVLKVPTTLKKAGEMCEKLKAKSKAAHYFEEYKELVQEGLQKEKEAKRLALVAKAMESVKKGELAISIIKLEEALLMKADRSIFLTLCSLYEDSAQRDKVRDLETRWAEILEVEEKKSKLVKEINRYFAKRKIKTDLE
ncbi:MAG: hypothetical protein A2508_02530 [Candidatus Lambdaproteobacteria bacterium RIFOXYD12_FULL_49_8]|uniref:Uncharacterized protein n=1 Tax=Candidatus Lambdaproteobacteria bacterium RIFOXYD2_FULL_50_16 TaxID=1817772 RepID=A0A1F6G876_9PROT|nr:MAG: hypothetical protein A2527_00500 [Candidatus Lambdaproteobacteria bacterium RIFOXYD2_FULL_50_16]OGG98261.1 MAG: hypothetical protein A2508_02530 [Candidatus Lambdaproteobacteria bacterium RIFOXYD12_FULL_49_8]